MTRDERAARREQQLKDRRAADARELIQVQAQRRTEARTKLAKRQQRVGTLAYDAGLFLWEDSTLAGLFQILATLHETPDPVAVLDSLLGNGSLALTETAAAASPCRLTSLRSDSLAVSNGRGGVLSPDRGERKAP